jgi:signal transduction histidine kinase
MKLRINFPSAMSSSLGIFREIATYIVRTRGWSVVLAIAMGLEGYRHQLPRIGEGTGLGLSISYEIVAQQHGGTITVDSEVGEFTEFTLRLPRRRHAVSG